MNYKKDAKKLKMTLDDRAKSFETPVSVIASETLPHIQIRSILCPNEMFTISPLDIQLRPIG